MERQTDIDRETETEREREIAVGVWDRGKDNEEEWYRLMIKREKKNKAGTHYTHKFGLTIVLLIDQTV